LRAGPERNPEENGMSNPYPSYTPEHRVFEGARAGPDLTPEQVLEAAGWVPHDGTSLRSDLLAQYSRESGLLQRHSAAVDRQAVGWVEAEPAQARPLDRSAAFTALLELSADFRQSDMAQGSETVSRFLADFYASGAPNMYRYARAWVPAHQAAASAGSPVARDGALPMGAAAPAPALEPAGLPDVTMDTLGWPTEKDTVSANLAATFDEEPPGLEL
jgi:hypothetical protein